MREFCLYAHDLVTKTKFWSFVCSVFSYRKYEFQRSKINLDLKFNLDKSFESKFYQVNVQNQLLILISSKRNN